VFNRVLEREITAKLRGDKAIIILGARQVGKTTLLGQLFASKNTLWLNGDDADTRELLAQPNVGQLKRNIGKAKYVVIDEAQRIPNIGVAIKIITDRIKTTRVIATGSSSFELRNQINEPLTGRKWEFQMFPLSFYEMVQHHGLLD
jgi:predicted AAA+ superfamily ATPase